MDLSINYQLIGLSLTSRTPPVNQGRFRFPTADRFIPFRRNSQDTSVKYSKLDENADSLTNSPDCVRNLKHRDSIGSGTGEVNENVFSQERAIRSQVSVREAQRRSERTSSANSLDITVGSMTRSFSCDESSPRNQKSRVLNFFSPDYNGGRRGSQGRRDSQVFSPTPETSLREEELCLTPIIQKSGRKMPSQPESKRDLPGIREDVYSQVLSWGNKGVIAVAFDNQVFVWDPQTNGEPIEITAPVSCPPTPLDRTPPWGSSSEQNTPCDVTAVEWDPKGTKLAFGNELGYVWLWKSSLRDRQMPLLREPEDLGSTDHLGQVTCLAWLPTPRTSIVFAGTMSCRLEAHDLKQSSCSLIKKTCSAICRIVVSPDGRHLAVATSGRRNGMVSIICTQSYKVTWKFKPHTSFVKAMAWCPWQPWVLATGGLTDEDGTIRIWSTNSEKLLHESTAGAQVTDLVWSGNTMELISGHGGASNSVLVWPWNLSNEPCHLTHHRSRVIHLALSPNGKKLASASGYGEEMLCIWNCFGSPISTKVRTPSWTRSPLAMCIR